MHASELHEHGKRQRYASIYLLISEQSKNYRLGLPTPAMSAALNINADSSSQSQLTLQDLSLGSLPSLSPGFSTPGRSSRIPSGTTAASSALVNTPSPGSVSASRRLGFSRTIDDQDEDGSIVETPGRFTKDVTGTPGPLSSKRKSAAKGSSNLTLRDQEKVRLTSFMSNTLN